MIRRTPKGYREIEETVNQVLEPFRLQMKPLKLTVEVVNQISDDFANSTSSFMADWDMFS